jgi:hypothetical protein
MPDMAKSKIQVRHLTLPPSNAAALEESSLQQDVEEDYRLLLLEKEQLARITDISIMAGEGNHPRPHVHGVEAKWGSKFWASEDDDASTVASNVDELASPTLVSEALATGFTADQLRQAEEELVSPTIGTPKVRAKLKEGSISKKIIEFWVTNRQNRVKPCSGPLPPPRQSPIRTFGDAIKNAKIESKRKSPHLYASKDHHHGSNLSQSPPDRSRSSPMVTGSLDRRVPRLDLAQTGRGRRIVEAISVHRCCPASVNGVQPRRQQALPSQFFLTIMQKLWIIQI